MRSNWRPTTLLIVGVISLVFARDAFALPSFARDSKVSCFSCHYKSSAQYISSTQLVDEDRELVSFSSKTKGRVGIRVHGDPVKSTGKDKISQMFLPSDSRSRSQSEVGGLSGYYNGDMFQASVGWLNPKSSVMFLDEAPTAGAEMWYRLALTPSAGGVNFTIGLFGAGGRMEESQDSADSGGNGVADYFSIPFKTSAVGIDAGVSGAVAGLSVKLKTIYLSGNGLDINGHRLGDSDPRSAPSSSLSAKAQVGIGRDFGLSATYSTYMLGDGAQVGAPVPGQEKSATIGAWIKIKDKINIMPEYTIYGPEQQWLDKGSGEFYLRFFTGF